MIYLNEERGAWMFDQATQAEKEQLQKLGERYFANAVAASLAYRMQQEMAESMEQDKPKESAQILDFPTVGNA